MFYSKSAGGFYNPAVQTPPNDAIELTGDEYDALMATASSGPIVADATGRPVRGAPTLEQTQSTQIAVLTQAYNNAIARPVSYTSKAGAAKTYQADPDSVGKLQNMLAACSGAQATPTGFYWVAADNTQEPFTYADLQGLAAAMGAQGFAAFAHLQTLKAEVRAASDSAAVAAVVW